MNNVATAVETAANVLEIERTTLLEVMTVPDNVLLVERTSDEDAAATAESVFESRRVIVVTMPDKALIFLTVERTMVLVVLATALSGRRKARPVISVDTVVD